MAVQKLQKIEKFAASSTGEVLGLSLLALPACLHASQIMPLLERHGFGQIDPNKWYPQQNILMMYKDILEGRSNVSESLVSIGIKSVDTMQFPPEVNTVEAVLEAMATSYQMVHRNLQPGEYTTLVKVAAQHYQMILNMPYPDDIFYGYYWGIMKKYTPKGMQFRVAQAAEKPDMPGTVYDIQWGVNL